MDILAILAESNVITPDQASSVAARAKEEDISLEAALIKEGVKANVIRDTLGTHFDLPTKSIAKPEDVANEALEFLPVESANHYKILPLSIQEGVLEVGIIDPDDLSFREPLNFITARERIPYKLVLILEQDFANGIDAYENLSDDVDDALDTLMTELDSENFNPDAENITTNEHIKEDAPVTKIVATILRYAVDGNASDIHIQPHEKKTMVRFRVDGILRHSLELPSKAHSAVVARIKILASLRLDEKRKPQDGRFSASVDNRKIDFRVSVLPTSHGEKVVMRILDTDAGVRKIEDTGVSEHNIELIREAVNAPYGIVLISGPTGSGKSTTLYAMLEEIDRESKNVISLEDPVEYDIAGVSQSQIRPEIGYTFATGLRSVLRQDPDVILVGEIRDKETAQLAIQAALTGHLVLSTIHTNNAAGVVPRLIDMGVDPYLIAPTLRLALAQRLVRRICPNSGIKHEISGSIKKMIDAEFADLPEKYRKEIPESDNVLFVEPTPECSSGTRGRVAVMEAISVNNEIEQLILDGADEETIQNVARKNGFISMKEDAIIKALKHTIPFEEVGTLGATAVDDEESEDANEEDTSESVEINNNLRPEGVDNPKIVL